MAEVIQTGGESIVFDTSAPGYLTDPYPTYRLLRERDPVHFQQHENGFRSWAFFRHEDISAVLQSDRFTTVKIEPPPGVELPKELEPIVALFRDVMLTRDPPDHTRLRGLVGKAFTPRMVERMKPRIERIMDELLEAALKRGELDLVRDIGVPFPLIVIAELLGVPVEDQPKLKEWSDDIAPMLDGSIRDQALPKIIIAAIQLRDYLAAELGARREQPREDLLSALLSAQEADDRLTDLEIVATSLLVLGAGHETTTNLICNGMWALLKHPAQAELLRAQPDLIPGAVDEMLRWDSPVQMTARLPREDIEIAGAQISAGTEIGLILGSANRDPAVFDEPERFDVTRTDNRHLSFGRGAHFCLGTALARLEGQIAVRMLLERLPDLRLTDAEPSHRPGIVLRGLHALPVSF